METDRKKHSFRRCFTHLKWVVILIVIVLQGCTAGPLTGLVYSNVRYPLTRDLKPTPMPENTPAFGHIIQVKEPISGYGFYAKVNSNAIGDIAKKNGIKTLYFADQETFSILGIWTTNKVILYGEK